MDGLTSPYAQGGSQDGSVPVVALTANAMKGNEQKHSQPHARLHHKPIEVANFVKRNLTFIEVPV